MAGRQNSEMTGQPSPASDGSGEYVQSEYGQSGSAASEGAASRGTAAVPSPRRPARTVLSYVLGRLLPAWLALALVLALLLTLAALLRFQAQTLERAATQINVGELLRADVLDMETGLRGYALTGDASFLEPYTRATGRIDQRLVLLQRALPSGRLPSGSVSPQTHLDQTTALIAQWRKEYVVPLLTAQQPMSDAARAGRLSRTGKQLVDRVRLELDAVSQVGQRQENQAQASLQRLSQVWFPLLGLLALLALALNLRVLLRLSAEIRRGMQALTEAADVPPWLLWQETEAVRASVGAVRGELESERETLRRTDLTLGGVLNAMTAQVWLIDAAGMVVRVNRAAQEELKLDSGAFLGQPLEELWPELAAHLASSPALLSHDQLDAQGVRTLPQELPSQEPRQLATPRGARWYLITQELQEGGRLLLLTDVTQLQTSHGELQDLNRSLSRSNTDLEHYAFVASHDLQEPLRTIASFAGLLLSTQGERLDERGQFYARNVIVGAERLKTLIQDLLSFAKVRAEVLEFTPVDMRRVTESVLVTLQDEMQRCGASITLGPLPAVLGRESLLTQLMYNLLQNALKFCREDRPIRLSVTARAADEPALPELSADAPSGAEAGGELIHFTVEDNGIGIEPQYHEQVFVIFQRLHGRARYSGNGLGLAICRRITELHGGRIWLESEPERGSRFHFLLPAAALPAGTESS